MKIKVKVEFTFDGDFFTVPSINGIQAYIDSQPAKFVKDADECDVFGIEVADDCNPTPDVEEQ